MADLPNGGEVAPPLVSTKSKCIFQRKQRMFLINFCKTAEARANVSSAGTTQPPVSTTTAPTTVATVRIEFQGLPSRYEYLIILDQNKSSWWRSST